VLLQYLWVYRIEVRERHGCPALRGFR